MASIDFLAARPSSVFGRWIALGMTPSWTGSRSIESRAGVCIGASTFPVVEGNLPSRNYCSMAIVTTRTRYLSLCRAQPNLLAQRDIPSISTLLSCRQQLRGPSCTVQSACTSATQAAGEALYAVRRGDVDVMVTGGTDSMMSVICVTGFTLLGALTQLNDRPEKASRPFDLKRDGFLIGEGAGIVIFEELEHAKRRNAVIHAEVLGYGSSSDGYRFTDIHPEGLGPARCMRAALKDADIGRRRRGLHQCSRDFHSAERPGGDLSHQAGLWRVCLQYSY